MKKYTVFAFIIVVIVLVMIFFGISKSSSTKKSDYASGSNNMSEKISLIHEIDDSTENNLRIKASFLTSSVDSKLITLHASQYIDSVVEREPEILSVAIFYYDLKIYEKYNDTPVATFRWAPFGSYHNVNNIEVGDHSQNQMQSYFSIYNSDYELSENEIALYTELQEQSIRTNNKPIVGFYDIDHPSGDLTIYCDIAEKCDVTVQELMTIRIKATMRRTFPE